MYSKIFMSILQLCRKAVGDQDISTLCQNESPVEAKKITTLITPRKTLQIYGANKTIPISKKFQKAISRKGTKGFFEAQSVHYLRAEVKNFCENS